MRIHFQGKTLGPENLISYPQTRNVFKKVPLNRPHSWWQKPCHWEAKMLFRLLYQPHELNHLAVVRKTRSFSFQKALQAFTCTFLLHYSTLAHLFTFSTFYQFRLPLLYIVKKSLNPKSVKLFLMKIFTELPWKIIFVDWCLLSVF